MTDQKLVDAISGLDVAADALIALLDEAGYVIKRKPAPRRATRPAAEVFSPSTGDDRIDAFMRRRHDPRYRQKKPRMPTGAILRPLSEAGTEALTLAWEKECDLAREEIARGLPSRAEEVLRETIALHRSPWHRVGRTEYDGDKATRTLESRHHPGVTIRVTLDRYSANRTEKYTVMRGDAAVYGPTFILREAEGAADRELERVG